MDIIKQKIAGFDREKVIRYIGVQEYLLEIGEEDGNHPYEEIIKHTKMLTLLKERLAFLNNL